MIDVVRAITSATAVQTPIIINGADAQHPARFSPADGLNVRNQLAGILSDLPAARKANDGKAASAVNGRGLNREPAR